MGDRARLWQIARGIALIVTGFIAASGATLSCALRNKAEYGSVHPPMIGPDPGLSLYVVLFGLMVVWIGVALIFAWRNRNPSGLALSVIAVLVFAVSAANVMRTAYPVCNAF